MASIRITNPWLRRCAALSAVALTVPMVVAAAPPTTATTFTNHRFYATSRVVPKNLWYVRMASSGDLVSRTKVVSQGVALDAASGRLVYQYKGKLWLRNRAGTAHTIAEARPATFTPDGSLVTYQHVYTDPQQNDFSAIYTYRISNRHVTKLLDLPINDNDLGLVGLRYSLDGKYLWMAFGYDETEWTDLYRLRLSDHVVTHVREFRGLCDGLEMLPDRARMLVLCSTAYEAPVYQLNVLRLSDGKLLSRTRFPATTEVTSIHGRVDPHHLLVSYLGYKPRTDRSTGSWLGTMDTRTFAVKRIPGSGHLYGGVAEYS